MGKSVLAVVATVATIALAVAAPYLGAALAGALAITSSVGVALVTAGVTLALSLGASFAFQALGVGPPTARQAVGPPTVFRQSIANSFIVYGRRRVGGLLGFYHSKQGESGAHFRYYVIAVAGHQIAGFDEFMLNDEVVTRNPDSGLVTSGKYANNAWLWPQVGLPDESGNAGGAVFRAECDGKWTTAHKGNGIAAIYAKFKLEDDALDAGMPNITAIVRGKNDIADPRGGDPGYTPNAALVFYDWLKLPREEGGFGAYPDEFPDAAWIAAQANVCDEIVNGQKRYELHGVITTGAPPGEVRDALILNCAGTYTYSGGKHLMRPGYWVPVTATLSEDDLAGPIQVSAFLPGDAAANEVQGTYISPEANFQGAAFTTQKLASPPTDVRQTDLDLAFTTSLDQANRIARIMLNRAQAETAVVWPMNIEGLKVRALDTVQLATMRYGLSNYSFSIGKWELSPDWGAVLNLREERPDIYDLPPLVTPPTPPPVNQPTAPVQSVAETTRLISASWVSGLSFSIADTGAVTISNHTRNYEDKSVAVTGTGGTPHAVSGAAAGDKVFVFYDQATRAGGAVSYQHLRLAGGTGDASSAYASAANPYRHFVCVGVVPAAAGTTSGGSNIGSGGGTSNSPGGIGQQP